MLHSSDSSYWVTSTFLSIVVHLLNLTKDVQSIFRFFLLVHCEIANSIAAAIVKTIMFAWRTVSSIFFLTMLA